MTSGTRSRLRRGSGSLGQVPGTRVLPSFGYIALAITDTLLAVRPGRLRARLVTKPLLMPTLAGRSVTAPPGPGRSDALIAQAFSWGGDVALLREGRGSFLIGLSSFLAAHVTYVSAYRRRSSVPLLASPGRRRVLASGVLAAVGMAWAASRQDRALAAPVGGYVVALSTMVAAAAAVDADRGRTWILTGASLFLVSDGLLGVRGFLVGDAVPVLDAAVMATYTAAQRCIAEGMTSGPGPQFLS